MGWALCCGSVGVMLALSIGCSPRGQARATAAQALDCSESAVQLERRERSGERRSFIAECREFHQPPPLIVTCQGNRCEDVKPCAECLAERRKELGLPPAQEPKLDENRL